jgi:hypothetical protein
MYKKHNEWKPILITGLPKGLAPKAVINSHPGAALKKHGGRMAVDNRGYQEKTNGKTGSILNADGNASPVTMPSNGKLKFATLGKMDMQLWGKTFCNFVEKGLAKNTMIRAKNQAQRSRTLGPGSPLTAFIG